MEDIENLILKAQNGSDEAMEELLTVFKPKVIAIARGYFLVGADFDDLIQEGTIGLYKAINTYKPNLNQNFGAFASLFIHRRLQNAVKNANRKKNSPLNSYVPIKMYDGTNVSDDDEILKMVIVDDNSDLEKNFIDKEMHAIFLSKIKTLLNEQEFRVLKMFINGDSYTDISVNLDLTTKKVDNMLQSIKRRLRTLKGEM